MASRNPRRRFGLRSRIILAFALGALTLSVILAFVAYGLTRENLLNRREEVSVSRAIFNNSSSLAPVDAAACRLGLNPSAKQSSRRPSTRSTRRSRTRD